MVSPDVHATFFVFVLTHSNRAASSNFDELQAEIDRIEKDTQLVTNKMEKVRGRATLAAANTESVLGILPIVGFPSNPQVIRTTKDESLLQPFREDMEAYIQDAQSTIANLREMLKARRQSVADLVRYFMFFPKRNMPAEEVTPGEYFMVED